MKDINESRYYGKRSLHKHYFLEDYDNNNVFDIEEYIKRKGKVKLNRRSNTHFGVNSFPSLCLLFLCSNSNEKISGASHHHGASPCYKMQEAD